MAPLWLNVKIGAGYRSAVALSDDGGRTWQPGGIVPPSVEDCNEGTVVEASDGTLWFSLRNRQAKCRAVALSHDEGQSWTEPRLAEDLVGPQCQASVLGIATESGQRCWVFSNPATTKRSRMTLKLSFDDGRRWPVTHILTPGPAAYSDLAFTKDGMVLCLYECGDRHAYERIRLARADWRRLVKDSENARRKSWALANLPSALFTTTLARSPTPKRYRLPVGGVSLCRCKDHSPGSEGRDRHRQCLPVDGPAETSAR